MKAIWTIAIREWRAMFLSPLAWTLLAVLFAICAYMFGSLVQQYLLRQLQYQAYGQAAMGGGMPVSEWTVVPLLGNTAVLLLLIVPLMSMRLIADEKRRGTWPALATSPLAPMQIILGKYLGLLLFLGATILLIAVLPASLFLYGQPDPGQFFSGLIGLFLLAATFGAIGVGASSATDNPVVAAVITFGALLLLWIAGWLGDSGAEGIGRLLGYASLIDHYEKFLQGVVSTADLAYFVIVSIAGLAFARQRLLAQRVEGF
ncbi:MAG: ABC transporter permease subunit [Magnetococcales bacterium]|nr:ABC transporter permease subunit [Magnetococcales bacterium]